MDFNKNYYTILGVNHQSTEKEIKKSYYKLSFDCHPDRNKEIDHTVFNSITEAYDVLMDTDLRQEYDKKSKFGKEYNEIEEFFKVDVDFNFDKENKKFEEFKKNAVLNVIKNIDDDFDGTVDYERWVICKNCNGSGKDLKSKFVIKDDKGNIKGIFDSDDGCDFCEGSGKDSWGNTCNFCFGQGKIGSQNCEKCNGEKRILGKQTLTGIKLDIDKSETIIKHMGHFSKNEPGKVGNLILLKAK